MMIIHKPITPFNAWTCAEVFIGGIYRATIMQRDGRHTIERDTLFNPPPLPKCLQPLVGRSWETHDDARRAVKRAYEKSPPEDEPRRRNRGVGTRVLNQSKTIPAPTMKNTLRFSKEALKYDS